MSGKDGAGIIVGAGLGGVAAALALLRSGIAVRVYERAPELGEVGAGISITPNGTRVLYSLGLKPQLDEWAIRTQKRRMMVWNTGISAEMTNQGDQSEKLYGSPYLVIHRADLHRILVDAVREIDPEAIVTGWECAGFHADAEGVAVRFSNGEERRGPYLIGADGVSSVIRRQLFGDAKAPLFTGQVRWRGLAPIAKVPEEARSMFASWIGPKSNVTLYPVRKGTLLNFVGSVTRDAWPAGPGGQSGTTEELQADYVGWHDTIQQVVRAIDKPQKWGLFKPEHLERWSEGRVTLLGDACHATLPALGQGANMAIEDACYLARCLVEYADVAEALKIYEDGRRPRTTRIVDLSTATAKRRENPALLSAETAQQYIESLNKKDALADWYDWIFKYDATQAQIPAEASN